MKFKTSLKQYRDETKASHSSALIIVHVHVKSTVWPGFKMQ